MLKMKRGENMGKKNNKKANIESYKRCGNIVLLVRGKSWTTGDESEEIEVKSKTFNTESIFQETA